MRDHEIIHCDFKPENIVLENPTSNQIKIIDLGSACFQEEKLYSYIQSRFYRSPEIILGYPAYSSQIDMWSFGCIVGELNSGKAFFPATSESELLALIMELRGIPP